MCLGHVIDMSDQNEAAKIERAHNDFIIHAAPGERSKTCLPCALYLYL